MVEPLAVLEFNQWIDKEKSKEKSKDKSKDIFSDPIAKAKVLLSEVSVWVMYVILYA